MSEEIDQPKKRIELVREWADRGVTLMAALADEGDHDAEVRSECALEIIGILNREPTPAPEESRG